MTHDVSWMLAGNVSHAAAQWGVVAAIAKISGPTAVGQYALALAVTAPVMLLANLHLREWQATDARRENGFRDYFVLRVVSSTCAFCLLIAFTLVSGNVKEVKATLAMVSFAKAIESISDVLYGRYQQSRRMSALGLSLILRATLGLVFVAIALSVRPSAAMAAGALAIAWLLVLLLHDLPRSTDALRIAPCLRFNRRDWGRIWMLASRAWPMGVTALLISLRVNVPIYWLRAYHGDRVVGLYAAMFYLVTAGTIVVASVAQTASPRLGHLYAAHKHKEFAKLQLGLVLFGTALGLSGLVLSLVAGPTLLAVLYSPAFGVASNALPWLMIYGAVSFMAHFLTSGLVAARCIKPQLPLVGASLLLSIGCAWFLVPSFGVRGAAWSLGIASALHLAGACALLWRRVALTRTAASAWLQLTEDAVK